MKQVLLTCSDLQFRRRTAAWSPCLRGPAPNTFSSGTSTRPRGNAGRLCSGAAEAAGTGFPPDKSAGVGVRRTNAAEGTGQMADELFTSYELSGKARNKSVIYNKINMFAASAKL